MTKDVARIIKVGGINGSFFGHALYFFEYLLLPPNYCIIDFLHQVGASAPMATPLIMTQRDEYFDCRRFLAILIRIVK